MKTAKPNDHSIYHDTVGQILSGRKLMTFFPDQYVKTILVTLRAASVGCAGVVDDKGVFVGILTEQEILRRIFSMLIDPTINQKNIGKYVDDMTVRDVMIRNPETLPDNTKLETALEIITSRGLRFMPVVCHENPEKLLGIIDERELAIETKRKLDKIRNEATQKEAVFCSLLYEPYGIGMETYTSH